jgi:hypothetical protein
MSTPVETPYVDPVFFRLMKDQGFTDLLRPGNLYDPEFMFEQLARFGAHSRFEPDYEILRRAINIAYSVFAKPRNEGYLKPLTIEETIGVLKLDTSAGIGLPGGKGRHIAEGIRRAYLVLEGKKAPNPCLCYCRLKSCKDPRLVFGYSIEMTMIEATFARPTIDVFMVRDTPMSISKPAFEIGTKINVDMAQYGNVYSIDFSKFDASVPAELIRAAFRAFATWFTEEDRSRGGWDIIVDYFITTPIVMPDEKVYVGKRKGVPSGSFFTQLVDSYVNMVAVAYLVLAQGLQLSKRRILVLGDDSIFAIRGTLDLEKASADAAKLNLKLSPEKCGVNTYHYLGYVWRGCYRDEGLEVTARKLVNPPRPRWLGLGKHPSREQIDTLNIQVFESMCVNSRSFCWKFGPKTIDEIFVTGATPDVLEAFSGTERQVALNGPPRLRKRPFYMRQIK